jgi:hypothetical protein
MKTELYCGLSSFAELPTGVLFRYGTYDREMWAIKVRNKAGQDGCLLLDPNHPRFGNLPVVVWQTDPKTPVVAFPDARLRPSHTGLRLATSARYDVGDVVLAGDQVLLYVGGVNNSWMGSESGFVDAASGEIVDHPREVPVAFKTWSIVQLVDGKPVTLFERVAAAAEDAAAA